MSPPKFTIFDYQLFGARAKRHFASRYFPPSPREAPNLPWTVLFRKFLVNIPKYSVDADKAAGVEQQTLGRLSAHHWIQAERRITRESHTGAFGGRAHGIIRQCLGVRRIH